MAQQQLTAKALFAQENVQQKFSELLGKRAQGFITSVLQIVSQNAMLANADPNSVFQAAATAATLDLPLNNNLGFAWIVPYNNKIKGTNGQPDTWQVVAQFQVGAKGFKQLAFRTGQFRKINETDVRQGEIEKYDRLTGDIKFKWIEDPEARLKTPIIGYASYFELLNGFSKTLYKTVEELREHGMKYSQTYKKGYGLWKDDFDGMARKTITKLNLSKDAPLSIEMQRAIVSDQAVINDAETEDISYVDNTIDLDALAKSITEAKSLEELKALGPHLDTDAPELTDLYLLKKEELTALKVSNKKDQLKAGQQATILP
jgi:recombination protein RecT